MNFAFKTMEYVLKMMQTDRCSGGGDLHPGNLWFVLKMMNCALKMMNIALKMVNSVLKMMDFALKSWILH